MGPVPNRIWKDSLIHNPELISRHTEAFGTFQNQIEINFPNLKTAFSQVQFFGGIKQYHIFLTTKAPSRTNSLLPPIHLLVPYVFIEHPSVLGVQRGTKTRKQEF